MIFPAWVPASIVHYVTEYRDGGLRTRLATMCSGAAW